VSGEKSSFWVYKYFEQKTFRTMNTVIFSIEKKRFCHLSAVVSQRPQQSESTAIVWLWCMVLCWKYSFVWVYVLWDGDLCCRACICMCVSVCLCVLLYVDLLLMHLCEKCNILSALSMLCVHTTHSVETHYSTQQRESQSVKLRYITVAATIFYVFALYSIKYTLHVRKR